MRKLTIAAVATILLLPARPAIAQVSTAADAPQLARSYWTYGGAFYSRDHEYEIQLFTGPAIPRGDGGGWTIRTGLVGGVSFWGTQDAGLMAGTHLALERVLLGDRIEIDEASADIYAILGGTGYVGRNLEYAPGETLFFAAAAAGVGLRFRGGSLQSPVVTFEFQHEERFDRASRFFIRLSYQSPRNAPPPAQEDAIRESAALMRPVP